jgi:hypothetical protein
MDLADDLHEKGGNERACTPATLRCLADDPKGPLSRVAARWRCATSARMEELVVYASVRRRQR